jgi:hypothetical protein
MDNLILICMPLFGLREKNGKTLLNFASVINFGFIYDGKVSYENKDSKKVVRPVSDFESSIQLFKLSEIDLNHFMQPWSNNTNNKKPIVVDEFIDTETYYMPKNSPLKIMLDVRENEVAIKPIV